jgi:hypothetical protein
MDNKLMAHWRIAWCSYVFFVLLSAILIRGFMSMLSSVYLKRRGGQFWLSWGYSFLGWYPGDVEAERSDLWFPFILGVIELFSYPVLMVTNNWTFIGAWIGFKTVAQWQRWTKDRAVFHRYLIGNALTVLTSRLLAQFVMFPTGPVP